MTLERRLAKLETARGAMAPEGPRVIFLSAMSPDDTGGLSNRVEVALLVGGSSLERGEDETEADFERRALAAAEDSAVTPSLPEPR
ncbi:hypothetical protein Rumeso_02631 [Rubellimicrobium mesophilum DSM 19309]|uniref:Uncharacterized protein n=1 Tax=Rubellimicrobium mesophilum DSM 19309 TaxID=442562 RepID=A0A017HQ01_9RHOB|nr:hypothetical protein [Rubellimicrobium mesophilum]EYD75849.1 hypothetical protein Rumeso_02631 [Rubellimicrobium mesophilum DSM 19309]